MNRRYGDCNEIWKEPPEVTETFIDIQQNENVDVVNQFLSQANDIKDGIKDAREKIFKIKRIYDFIAANNYLDDQAEEELEVLVATVQSHLEILKARLKYIAKNIEVQEKTKQTENCMKKSQHTALSEDLLKIISEYEEIKANHKEDCKNKIKKQLEIIYRNKLSIPDDTFYDMIQSDNPAIFAQTIISKEARECLQNIEARQDHILKLDANIEKLRALFSDLAYIIHNQGDLLGRIEHNVKDAGEYIEDVVTNIHKTDPCRQKSLSRKLLVACVPILLLLFIMLIAVLTNLGKKHFPSIAYILAPFIVIDIIALCTILVIYGRYIYVQYY